MGAAVVTIGWYCSGKWHKSQPFVQQTTITHIRVSENQKTFFYICIFGRSTHRGIYLHTPCTRKYLMRKYQSDILNVFEKQLILPSI